MCRRTNRLDSSAAVARGNLRDGGKQSKTGHQLHAVGHQRAGGTILESNAHLQGSAELIYEDVPRLLPPGGAHTYKAP